MTHQQAFFVNGKPKTLVLYVILYFLVTLDVTPWNAMHVLLGFRHRVFSSANRYLQLGDGFFQTRQYFIGCQCNVLHCIFPLSNLASNFLTHRTASLLNTPCTVKFSALSQPFIVAKYMDQTNYCLILSTLQTYLYMYIDRPCKNLCLGFSVLEKKVVSGSIFFKHCQMYQL